ncbi:MAG: hypothetical protein H6719_06905 [Sandaracinaceae bacterium]|nr:hypothetical protein [Sandaracinaceae bacterium]
MSRRGRSSRRQLAELAELVRSILEELGAAKGGPKARGHRAALDLVDAHVRGELVTPEALASARAVLTEGQARLWVHSSPLWRAAYHLPVDALLAVVERGDDLADSILERAEDAVREARLGGLSVDLEALRATALAHAAAFDEAPFAGPTDEDAARDLVLLTRSRAALPAGVRELFDFAGVERDASQTIDPATLSAGLAERDLPTSEAVLAFEADFGGLLVPLTTQDGWRADGSYTLVGPHAMLSTHSQAPRGGASGEAQGLVLVARGPQEDLYFLDPRGAAYRHWTTNEAGAVPWGADGAELVLRLTIAALTFQAVDPPGTLVFPPAARVSDVAVALGLTRLFADERSEWWVGAAAILVVLEGSVFGLARTERASMALQR